MRFVLYILLTIVGLLFGWSELFAQRFIHKNYGNSLPDTGVVACATTDGNIVSFGHNNIAGNNDLFFYKTNALGDSIWYKNYGFEGEEHAKAIVPSNNGGFIWAGTTATRGNKNIIIGKCDQNGNVLWNIVLDNGFEDDIALNGVYATSDGGAFLSGWSSTCAGGCFDSYVIRVGSAGNVLWQTIIPVSANRNDKAFGLTLNPTDVNSPLWVVGMMENNDPSDGYLMQVNKDNGRFMSVRNLDRNGIQDRDEFVSIAPLPNGSMMLMGNVYGYQQGKDAIQLLKVSANGTIASGFPVYLTSDESILGYKVIYSTTYSSLAIAASYLESRVLKPLILRINDSGFLPSDPHIYLKGKSNNIITSIFERGNQFICTGMTSQDPFAGGDNLAWHSIKADYTLRDVSCLITPFTTLTRVVINDFSAVLVANVVDQFATNAPVIKNAEPRTNDCLAYNSCCPLITPEINIDTVIVCVGTRKEITVVPNNNPNFFHYIDLIHESDPQANISIATTGNSSVIFRKEGLYFVKRLSRDQVTGCEYAYDDFGYTIRVAPPVLLENLPADTSVCPGQELRFNPRTNIANPIYQWSNSSTVVEQNNPNTKFILTIGIITNILRVTDPVTGCYDEDTVNVFISGVESGIIPNNLKNASVCKGTTFRLNTIRTYKRYEWSPAQFLDNPNARSPIVTYLNGGTLFRLKVTTDAGCVGYDSVYVNYRKLLTIPVNDTVLCEGSQTGISLSVRPDTNNFLCSYRWLTNYNVIGGNINSDRITVNPTRDTCYIVNADCPGGCSLVDTICIRIRQPLNIVPPSNVTICRGQSTILGVQGGTTYEWSPALGLSDTRSRRPVAQPDVTTTYTLRVFDALGCLQTFNVTVTVSTLDYIDLPSDTTICQGTGIRLRAGASLPNLLYFWDPQTGIPNGQEQTANPLITPPTTTKYIVEVINNDNNCSRLDTITIKVVNKPNALVVGVTELCRGQKTMLRAYGASRYFWVNAPNPGFYDSLEVNPSNDITYIIIPQVGNCNGDTIRHAIKVTPRPSASFNVSSQICAGNATEVRYMGNISPNETPVWQWDGAFVEVSPNGDPLWGPFLVTFNAGGTKKIGLKINSTNGCVDSLSKIIIVSEAPFVSAGRDMYSCAGEEVLLEGALNYLGSLPCSYTWTPQTGLNNPTVLQPTVKVSRTTTYILRASCGNCTSAADTVTIFVVDPPAVFTDTHEITICAGGSGVLLNTRVEDGQFPYYYEWTPTLGLSDARSPFPVANPTSETTYYVKVTDANGCTSMPAFTKVKVNPLPLVSAGPDRYLCSGTLEGVYMDGKVLNKTGSYEYRWSPVTGLADPTDPKTYASPLVTTIYTLTVTNRITGCQSDSTTKDTTATVVINVDKIPFVDAGPNEVFICKGDSVQIGSTATETGPNYRYVWSPSTGLSDSTIARPFAQPDVTTTYFFTAYAGGCQSVTDKITVSIKPFPVFSLESFGHICSGDTYQVKININSNQGPFIVQWSPTEGLSDPTALTPKAFPHQTTVYRCTIITAGCEEPFTDSVTVRVHPKPNINLNPSGSDLRICPAGTDSLYLAAKVKMPAPYENDPIYFEWKPTNGIGDSTDINTGIKPKETTTYTITIKTGKCAFIDSVTVFVLPFVLAKINPDTNDVCIGDTIRLKGSGGTGGANFVWRFRTRDGQLRSWRGDSLILVPDTSGWLTLTVTEGNCTDTDSLFIKARIKPVIKIDYALASGCDPLSVRFYTQSFYQTDWTWDFGDNTEISNIQNPLHTYNEAGRYKVRLIVRSLAFCEDTLLVEKVIMVGKKGIPKITSDPPAPVTLYLPFAEVQFSDSSVRAKDYFWEFGDGATSTEKNPQHKYVTPGSYTVRLTITDSSGCRETALAGIFEVKEPEIIIPNVFTPNDDGINDIWNVQYLGSEPITIQIFDRFGVLMHSYIFGEPGWNGTYQNGGTRSAEGTYFYMVKVGSKMFRGEVTLLR